MFLELRIFPAMLYILARDPFEKAYAFCIDRYRKHTHGRVMTVSLGYAAAESHVDLRECGTCGSGMRETYVRQVNLGKPLVHQTLFQAKAPMSPASSVTMLEDMIFARRPNILRTAGNERRDKRAAVHDYSWVAR
jgi:hypothetical protein